MKEKVLQYYRQGHNCSQCILRGAEQTYKIPMSKQCVKMCSIVSSGFGIGGICSVLVGGIMIFGLLFDENTAKSLRINLLTIFMEKYPTLNCSGLKKESKTGKSCEDLIADISDIIEKLIDEQLKEK